MGLIFLFIYYIINTMTFDYIIPMKDEFTPEDNFISDKLLQKYVDMNNITKSDFNKWIDKYRHIIENESKQHNNFYKRYLKKKITKKQMGGIGDDNITFYIIAIISYIFFEKQINSMDNPNKKKKGGATTIRIANNDVSLRQFPKISEKFHDVPNINIANNDVSLRQFPKISKKFRDVPNINIANNDVSLRQFPKISKKFRDVPKNTFRNYQEHILQERLNNLRRREQEIYQKNLEQQRERKRLEQIASKAEKKEYELRQTGQELQQKFEEERRKEQKEMQKNQIGKGKHQKKEKSGGNWGKNNYLLKLLRNQKRIEDAKRAAAAKYSILKNQANLNVGTLGNRVLFKAKRNGKIMFLKISVANVNMRSKEQIRKATNNFAKLDADIVGQYVTENILYKHFSNKKINMVEYIGHNLTNYDRTNPKIILPLTNQDIANVKPYSSLETINDHVKKLMVFRTNPELRKFVLTVLVTGYNPDLISFEEYLRFMSYWNVPNPNHVKESSIMKGLTFIHKLYHKFHFAHWDWHYENIRVDQNTGNYYLFDLDRSQLNTPDLKILPLTQSFFYRLNLPNNITDDKLLAYGYAHDINRFLFENNDLHSGVYSKPIIKYYKNKYVLIKPKWQSGKLKILLKDIFGCELMSFYTWLNRLFDRLVVLEVNSGDYWSQLSENTKIIYDKFVDVKPKPKKYVDLFEYHLTRPEYFNLYQSIGGKRGKRKIRTGPRGGKFVLIKGKKKYIH